MTKCEFCKVSEARVEGWFYTSAKNNPYAQGTAAAGLLQKRVACMLCANAAVKNGMTPAKEVPNE